MSPNEVRDIFEKALQACRDLEHLRARLARLQTPPLSGGIPQILSGSLSDPTGNTAIALVDGENEYREIEAARLAEIDLAKRLIRGVRQGLGLIYGDILEDYYIRGVSWEGVARINGIGKNTVLRKRNIAFDWIASLGIARAQDGDSEGVLGAQGTA